MNKPMNLKDLSAHLSNGGDDVVVDMGMIVEKPNWAKRTFFAFAICILLVGGFLFSTSTEEVSIVVNSEVGADVITTVIKENGGEVVNVDNNTYRIRLSRFKNLTYFLEKLRSNNVVDSVGLKN